VLKAWHKDDVFAALAARGWSDPMPLDYQKEWNYVGEAYSFVRANRKLKLYFVADFGTGFQGVGSVESAAAWIDGDPREYDLWLKRSRDGKWRAALIKWADDITSQTLLA
jgi:hypothetical protein